jgi:hypothetical protein
VILLLDLAFYNVPSSTVRVKNNSYETRTACLIESLIKGTESSDAEALRQRFKPISEEIRSASDKLGALLRVSSDLETKRSALRVRMREEIHFARISSVETKSEQESIPSVSPTRGERSSRRLSDNLVSLVQLANQLKDRLDEKAALAANPDKSRQQRRPLVGIAEDVGCRSPSPTLSEEPSTPIEEMSFANRWQGPLTASPEELLIALTTDVREAARNSRPLLKSIENHAIGRATPKETIDQLQIHLKVFETLQKKVRRHCLCLLATLNAVPHSDL